MTGSFFRATLIFLLATATAPAHAVVIGGAVTGGSSQTQGGVFIELIASSAFSVGNNTFQNPNLYAFNEGQNIAVSSTVDVNVGTAPTAGQTVASHYVFFDPTGVTRQTGFVDFDAPIYGIATSTALLAASDFLIASEVTYLNPGARGLEAGDSVSIDPANPNRVLVNWRASTPGDYVRVFTQRSPGAEPGDPGDQGPGDPMAIPLPAGLPLLASALALFALLRRRT
jgi:hypothetical protein